MYTNTEMCVKRCLKMCINTPVVDRVHNTIPTYKLCKETSVTLSFRWMVDLVGEGSVCVCVGGGDNQASPFTVNSPLHSAPWLTGLDTKWVRLARNGQIRDFFRSDFSTFWCLARRQNILKYDLKKMY